ncbi:hypothetical protein NEILACOT_04926 [Neisseria lactamica ATCC 23970]|uniref:Uncharacterized protein n=1 Tax=Neisseria lactamica ATCC 23970 TaxID=546265 RepID=D0WBJ9_NEILA|nr:hypothetical protein NEILACOT_04926 [Neisseria lactamica ATCC 23970]
MDNIDGVGGIGGNGGIGGLKPTLHILRPPCVPYKQHFTQNFASAEKISNGLFYQMRKI